jgi:hypothetical protein
MQLVHKGITIRDLPIQSGPSIIRGTRVRGSKRVGVRHIGVFEYIELLPPGIAIRDLPTRSRPSVQWTRGRDLHRRRKSRPGVKSVRTCGPSGIGKSRVPGICVLCHHKCRNPDGRLYGGGPMVSGHMDYGIAKGAS